ncbi:hypothetical protein ACH4S8_27095 [Streptomyces sp. NPDC021080]|uniref:hypothetical protein n=1 Tax=Streptomyces sp. NPDC021080 TaxID=3365110 RepID=UPI0037BDF560
MIDGDVRTGGFGSDGLPSPRALLDGTDWSALGTARGNGSFLPTVLRRLLDADPAVRMRAVGELEPVCHQNSFYEATLAVALYVAAVLNDPATEAVGHCRRIDPERDHPVRVALLEWLGSLAHDGDDESLAAGGRHFDGDFLDEYPEMRAFREHRPVFYRAVSPFLAHEDVDVRHAAVVAALPLIEHPGLATHQDALAGHARCLLLASTDRYNRSRCLDALKNWGHDVTALETADDVRARKRDVRAGEWTGGCTEEPPF